VFVSENRFAHWMLAPAGVWLLILFLIPLAIVLLVSLGRTDPSYQAVYGWHPGNFADVFDPLFAPVLLRSVGYALATVALCLLIGYPIAYYIARFGGRWKTLLIAAVVLPFLVNYLVRTYAWVAILSDEGLVNGILADTGIDEDGVRLVNTSWAVIGGLVYGYLAFMILPLYAALDRMDPSLIEAGKDLYGTRWQTFWHVTWPAAFQGVAAGCVLVFLPAVGDFISAQLLGGPDTYMVGNLIQQQFLEAQNWPFGAALTIVMMGFLLIWMLVYLRSAGRASQEAVA
jgi:spermidine/putrescine transport system permease protein